MNKVSLLAYLRTLELGKLRKLRLWLDQEIATQELSETLEGIQVTEILDREIPDRKGVPDE